MSQSQSQQSPNYNILAPKPWTSFKETPPSPLLVLQRRDSRTGQLRPSIKKARAPQPPVRTSSLTSAGSPDESDGEIEEEVVLKTSNSAERMEETQEIVRRESLENEVMIEVTTEKRVDVEEVADETDAKTEQTELVLDVQKLPVFEITEDIADNEGKPSAEDNEVTEPLENDGSLLSPGKKLSILGLSGFIEGLSSSLFHHFSSRVT